MGHDTHFLGRLDRVSDAHVERALALYRDQALLKEVLNRANLAEGVERLAISLDDPREGPFVIVTREGRFVTCLGKGMRLSKDSTNTLLTRERLDAAAAKVERMREHLAEVERLMQSGAEGVGARAFRRMANDGLRFCREDAETLLGAVPLFVSEICVALTRTVTAIHAHRRDVARLRFDKLNSREEQLALDFGRWAWAAAHLIAFADHDDVQALFMKINEAPEVVLDMTVLMSFNAFDLGTLTHATRALWLIGRRPRLVLADVKSLSLDGRVQLRVLRELALGVIAHSSSKHRTEARKALSRPPMTQTQEQTRDEALASYAGIVGGMVRAVLDNPARRDAAAVAEGRLVVARLVTKRAEVSDEERAAIPERVARAAVGSLPLSWLAAEGGASRIDQLCGTLPWIARAEAADLFLPREHAQLLPVRPLDDVQQMIAPYAQLNFLARPKPVVRRGEKLGRNDPCPCGSGKKRKRCCATASG